MGAGALWREKARYEFTASDIDHIESAADEVHVMLMEAARFAVAGDYLPAFGLSQTAARLVEGSWRAHWSGGVHDDRAGALVGRLTFAFDGYESLKLLEAQYDGAPGLFAAAIIQRNWMETQLSNASQFNGLHEGLVERWAELARAAEPPAGGVLHLTCLTPDPAREGELAYIAATAQEAGIAVDLLPLQSIGWDGRDFRTPENQYIGWLYKLYPWQSAADEAFGGHLRSSGLTVLEPAWGWLLSNHGLLALLGHLYPGHPNLCRAGGEPAAVAGAERVIQRSFMGLEHAATRLLDGQGAVLWANEDETFTGPTLWMEAPPLYEDGEGVSAVIDAWIVGGKCLGMSVRESAEPMVGPLGGIVPHHFVE